MSSTATDGASGSGDIAGPLPPMVREMSTSTIASNVSRKRKGSLCRDVSDMSHGSDHLVTAHIQMTVDITDSKWENFRRGIRLAATAFKGYRSIRSIDLGASGEHIHVRRGGLPAKVPLHRVVVLIKFEGYNNLMRWLRSEERKHWVDLAYASGLMQDEDRKQINVVQDDGVIFDLAQSHPTAAPKAKPPPAKWRLFLVTWMAVYPMAVLNGRAGTTTKLARHIGDATAVIYVHLMVLVPVIGYVVIPLLLRLGLGFFLRGRRCTCLHGVPILGTLVLTLEDGLGLFQPTKQKADKELLERLDVLEGKLSALKEEGHRHRERLVRRFGELESPRERKSLFMPLGAGREASGDAEEPSLALHQLEGEAEGKLEALEDAEDSVEGVTVIARHCVRWERSFDFEEEMRHMSYAMHRYSEDFMGLDVFTDRSSGHAVGIAYVSIFRFRQYSTLHAWMHSQERSRELRRLAPLLEKNRGSSTYSVLPLDQRNSGAATADAYAEDLERGVRPAAKTRRGRCAAVLSSVAYGDCHGWGLAVLKALVALHKRIRRWLGGRQGERAAPMMALSVDGADIGLMLRDVFGDTLVSHGNNANAVPPPQWKTAFLTWLPLATIQAVLNPRLQPEIAHLGDDAQTAVLSFCSVLINVYIGAPFAIFIFGNWLNAQDAREASVDMGPWRRWINTGLPNAFWMALILAAYVAVLLTVVRDA